MEDLGLLFRLFHLSVETCPQKLFDDLVGLRLAEFAIVLDRRQNVDFVINKAGTVCTQKSWEMATNSNSDPFRNMRDR